MAFLDIKNVKIVGVSAAVPTKVEYNSQLYEKWGGYDSFVVMTGVERKRKANFSTCSSDLGVAAAEELMRELNWGKEEVDAVIFVSQTPDYITPATSCLIQKRLGLSESCYTLDISLGCSGWVYALSVISSLLQNGSMRKGLLIAADTMLKSCSEEDKSTYPLFGDAGTATALEYDELSNGLKFSFNTDGSGYQAVIIQDGGYRNPVTLDSFNKIERGKDIVSNRLQLILDGMNVFSFGISKAPSSVNGLLEKFNISKNSINYFLFHQANLFMNEKIRKKLKLTEEQTPYCLKDFGNTSCASIPLTMIVRLRHQLMNEKLKNIACGFGVGLSWGSVYFETENITCPELIEI